MPHVITDEGLPDASSDAKEAPPLLNEQNNNVSTTTGRGVGAKTSNLQMTDSVKQQCQLNLDQAQKQNLQIQDHPCRKQRMENFQFDEEGKIKDNSQVTVM